MTNLRITKIRAPQRGAAFLLFVLVFMVVGGGIGFRALNRATAQSGIDDQTATSILAQSKEALLAWSSIPL